MLLTISFRWGLASTYKELRFHLFCLIHALEIAILLRCGIAIRCGSGMEW